MPHYKILVIDYEPRGVAQLRDPLHAAGYLVTVAHDGVSGMELFEKLKPDLTLIEAMLPKKHGFEVCGDLKQTPHGAKSPVVIVTSVYRGRKYRTQAFHSYHCDEFLEKPISSATLLSTVERLLKDRPQAAAEPEAAAPAPPAVKSTARPEAEPAAAAPTSIEDDAELEISERLDDLFGGGSDSGPQASAASAPDGENLLPFDPSRGRGSATASDTATVPGGPLAGSSGGGPATAEAVQAAHAYQPTSNQRPRVVPKPWPELRDRHSRPTGGQQPTRGRSLLLLTILVVAAASSAIFLLLNWPF